ncbi:MAG: HAD family phosphatase [Eubacteriales bacterium]|nr:HAD family phosphatase [Eubacteriales bacterium]
MIDFGNFECAIFDLDGTLIDSTGVWDRVDTEFLGKRGILVPDDYIQNIKLHNFETGARYTVERFLLNEKPEDIVREWFDMAIEEYAHHIQLKPYAKELLQGLKKRGIKLAIATSADRSLYEPCLKRHNIYDWFDNFTQTSETGRGKEFADVYELAAKRCNTDVSKCIVFEDILAAVKGAKSGGFYTAAVADEASEKDREQIIGLCDVFLHDYSHIVHDLIL